MDGAGRITTSPAMIVSRPLSISSTRTARLFSTRMRTTVLPARRVTRPEARCGKTLDHKIFTPWPAQYADRLQPFSAPTPNGVKVGIMLEETSLAYEPHRIDIMADGAVWIPKDFYMAMAVAGGCVRSRHARGVHYRAGAPRRLHPARLTRSVSVISRPARPGGNNEERRPTYSQKEKAHEDPNHHRRRPRLLDGLRP